MKTNPWSNAVTMVNGEKRVYHYDAEHERKRKEQLRRLFDRTQEQVNAISLLDTGCIELSIVFLYSAIFIQKKIFITAY